MNNKWGLFTVPFCGLAVIEALSGVRSPVEDPYLEEAKGFGYQALQPWQKQIVDEAASFLGLNSKGKGVQIIEK